MRQFLLVLGFLALSFVTSHQAVAQGVVLDTLSGPVDPSRPCGVMANVEQCGVSAGGFTYPGGNGWAYAQKLLLETSPADPHVTISTVDFGVYCGQSGNSMRVQGYLLTDDQFQTLKSNGFPVTGYLATAGPITPTCQISPDGKTRADVPYTDNALLFNYTYGSPQDTPSYIVLWVYENGTPQSPLVFKTAADVYPDQAQGSAYGWNTTNANGAPLFTSPFHAEDFGLRVNRRPCTEYPTDPEICDGLDNDCDGSIDEDYGVGQTCDGVGSCGLGVKECASLTTIRCSSDAGGTSDQSAPEVCDGFDTNCNGQYYPCEGVVLNTLADNIDPSRPCGVMANFDQCGSIAGDGTYPGGNGIVYAQKLRIGTSPTDQQVTISTIDFSVYCGQAGHQMQVQAYLLTDGQFQTFKSNGFPLTSYLDAAGPITPSCQISPDGRMRADVPYTNNALLFNYTYGSAQDTPSYIVLWVYQNGTPQSPLVFKTADDVYPDRAEGEAYGWNWTNGNFLPLFTTPFLAEDFAIRVNRQPCTPTGPELCDGLDNDCDGLIDELVNIVDADGDGWTCDADCKEIDPAIHPGALDCFVDGVDNDCDGVDGNGANTVNGYVAFDVNPATTGDEVRITNATVLLCEVDGSGNENNCRSQAVNSTSGSYSFACMPSGTYRVKTALSWTDRVITANYDPQNPIMESRIVFGKTNDFTVSPSGGTLPLQPILFKLPVVFVHGANAGACLDGTNHPGVMCGSGTCVLYKNGWTTAFDRFIADDYVSFVADGLVPCEAPRIAWCADGTSCVVGTTCGDASLCTERCEVDFIVCNPSSTCAFGSCMSSTAQDLHDYNAKQLAVYLTHVDSILTTSFTGGTQVPVDIVAHSMGGLTTRDLIGSDLGTIWAPMIRKLVMVGTPNAGSVNAEARLLTDLLGRPDARYLTRRAMWVFNQKYGEDDSRTDSNNRAIPFYQVAGSGGPDSGNFWYRRLSTAEPNPNDGIVGWQSAFDYEVTDSGPGFHGNAGFRNNNNCKPPRNSTSTDNCLIRIQADAYVCTPDDHSELQTTTATIGAVQDLLADEGNTNPSFDCTGAPALLTVDDVSRLTRQSSGSLSPLGFVEHSHVIDSSTESVFSVEWQTGTFTFTLEDPLGGVIDPAEAATNPDIEYLDGTGGEQGSVLVYIVQNPMSGVWKLQITAGSDVNPTGEAYLAETTSNAVVDVVGASLTDPADVGNTVALTATLTDDGTAITGGTVTALVTDRLGSTTPLSCLDNGVSPDVTAGDGVYTCSYGPIGLSGHHAVEFQASGTRLDAVPFERSNTFILSVNSTDASIDGTFSESSPDVNTNLLHDSLNVDVDITVAVGGEYGLEGTLVDGSSVVVDHQVLAGQMLTVGAHTLTLVFNGVAIREHGVDGPYTLTNLVLTRGDTDQAVCEEAANAYTTGSYLWADFEIRDPDGDGIESASDNCPNVANPLQEDTDTDSVGNACDNCPGISNTGQADQDSDGFGDACDLCPSTVDAYQNDADGDTFGDNCDPDADADGVLNASDCAVLDNTLWSSPSDVTDLAFTNQATLAWSVQTPADGSVATFDVVKGDLTTLRSSSGNFSTAVCFVAHDPATTATDSLVPSPGSAFYYLVRPRTGCGVGTYGSGTAGERLIVSCP